MGGGRRAVEVEAWGFPGGCLASVAVGGVVAVVVAKRVDGGGDWECSVPRPAASQ